MIHISAVLQSVKKRDRGTEKSKVFVAVSIDKKGRPKYLKMQTTDNIQQKSVREFAQANIQAEATIISDGYRSYIPALKDYKHEHGVYNPDTGMLHWLHTMIGNARAFILGTITVYLRKTYRNTLMNSAIVLIVAISPICATD